MAYVYSIKLDSKAIQYLNDSQKDTRLHGQRLCETRYQAQKEQTLVIPLAIDENVRMVSTVRLMVNEGQDSVRVIPFVLMPHLDAEQTERLEHFVLSGADDDVLGWFSEMRKPSRARTRNEAITMYLSNIVLQEFLKLYELTDFIVDRVRSFKKIVRNYYWKSYETTHRVLAEFLRLSEQYDMGAWMRFVQGENWANSLFSLRNQKFRYDGYYDINAKFIVSSIEEYFYDMAYYDEVAAVRKYGASQEKEPLESILEDVARNIGLKEYQVTYFIAVLLQMLDAGLLSVSTFKGKDHEKTKIESLGNISYGKAGEQSLTIQMMRIYKYMPMLVDLQEWCEERGRDLREFLSRFFDYWKKEISDVQELQELNHDIKEMDIFLKDLTDYEQTPKDWSGNYYAKLGFDDGDRNERMWEFYDEQESIKEKCRLFQKQYV